jgi:formamidopyrimidine-DNA glycosylase
VPELPEVEAHAERLTEAFAGAVLTRFVPLAFTALKTAVPRPETAYGTALDGVGRRGKFLLLRFPEVSFAVHLMQGGRLVPDPKQAARPRGGQARWLFADGRALLLTEQGTERKAGVWCLPTAGLPGGGPLDDLGLEAATLTDETLAPLLAATGTRIHGFLRDQHQVAGLGRRLANEICHRARLSPFATARSLTADARTSLLAAIRSCIDEGLAYERTRADMSASADRPAAVHGRTGEPCPVCGDVVRAVEYTGYTVNYCATCQTNGKVLADNTTSRFLK